MRIRSDTPEVGGQAPAGFTLVEVLLAVLLVAILAAVGVSQYRDFTNNAKTAVTQEKLAALKVAIDGDGRYFASGMPTKLGFYANCLALPTLLSDLVTQPSSGTCASVYNPYTKQGWRGPYVSSTDPSWSKDGWGNAIQYSSAGRTLSSCGPDGICGNGDDISVTF